MMNTALEPPLLRTMRDGVQWLTLNRPRAANALSQALQSDLVGALMQADADPTVRAIVISAAGGRVFSAGADLRELADMPAPDLRALRRRLLRDTLLALTGVGKPLLACVEGKAIGAGCMLSLLADETLASDTASFSLPEIGLGSASPLAVSIIMERGTRRLAYRMVQQGEVLDAAAALQAGLVDAVYPAATLAEAVQQHALQLGQIASRPHAQNRRWMYRRIRADIAAATGGYADWIEQDNARTSLDNR